MKSNSSRRTFLQAGLAVPAGIVGSRHLEAAAPAVPYRVLGKTGLKVAPVGFGCGFAPDPAVMTRAIDLGVNYFDTARGYAQGNSERIVGMTLKGGLRDKVVLVSKSAAKTKADALADLEATLKTLETDHVDIWMMHARDKVEQIPDELVEVWDTAKKQGKARFIGVSTHDPATVADRIVGTGKFDVVLVTYNFTVGTTRDAAIKKMHDAGIGLVAMKVMAPASGGQKRPAAMMTKDGPLSALKWVLKNPLIATTIPTTADFEQLEMNVRAMSEKFGAEDEKVLVARSEEIRSLYCRMCYDCRGKCPEGMPVTDVLRILAYNDFYGDFGLARTSYMELPRAVRQLSCADCSSCSVECPNGVHVAERLIRAQELLG